MNDFIRFAILGTTSGGAYTLLAVGVIVVFRASGVVNFANSAIAVGAGYAFYELRLHHVPVPTAVSIGIALGALFGGLMYLGVMIPLRQASNVTKAIATLAVLVVLQAAIALRYGTLPLHPESFLPQHVVTVAGARVTVENLIVLAIAMVVPLVLWLAYRNSRFGLRTSAVSDNPEALAALGISPHVIAAMNWGLAGAVGALAGIMIGPLNSINPSEATTFVVPALAVALFAGLTSLPMAIAGGLAIGITQSELTLYESAPVIRNLPGLAQVVPFVIVVIVLVARGRSLPDRGFVAQRLPTLGTGRVRWPLVGLAVMLFVLLILSVPLQWVVGLTSCLIASIILLSVVVVTGIAGQISLAQYALAGVSALVAARLVADLGWPLWAAAPLGIVSAIVVGVGVGIPAIRVRGVTLAIVTLAFAVGLDAMLFSQPTLTGSIAGIPVGPASLFGISIDTLSHPRRYAFVALVLAILAAFVVANLRASRPGRALAAIRGNERAAASLGVNVSVNKLYAFAVGAGLAGVGGVLLSFRQSATLFGDYGAFASINAVLQGTVGGVGHVNGAFIGSNLQPGSAGDVVMHNLGLGNWLMLIGGLLLLITVLTSPDGVAPTMQQMAQGIGAKLGLRRARTARLSRSHTAVTALEPAQLAAPRADTVVEVRGLSVTFGGVKALQGVDLDIRSGQVLGIIGPNGAGKTTLIDAISGFAESTGKITVDGEDISGLAPHERARRGLVRSFQSLELFEDLTVAENLLVASEQLRPRDFVTSLLSRRRSQLSGTALVAVQEFVLQDLLGKLPTELSYAQRRLLAISRAVAQGPKVLLLDEPASGLGETERHELGHLLRRLVEQLGMAVLLIEHDVELVMSVSDRVLALEFGKTIASGAPDDVRRDSEVRRSYLGLADAPVEASGSIG
jgi:ABC-type branched-subunit amino acid transport system ATPase component/branched-subunit amino acid ABC-type transport system permease component